MLTLDQQTALAFEHARTTLGRKVGRPASGPVWDAFCTRLEAHLPALLRELGALYGHRSDFLQCMSARKNGSLGYRLKLK